PLHSGGTWASRAAVPGKTLAALLATRCAIIQHDVLVLRAETGQPVVPLGVGGETGGENLVSSLLPSGDHVLGSACSVRGSLGGSRRREPFPLRDGRLHALALGIPAVGHGDIAWRQGPMLEGGAGVHVTDQPLEKLHGPEVQREMEALVGASG